MASINLILLALTISVPQGDTATEIRQKLDALAEKYFAGLVYVEKDGKEVFFHTVGYADRESKRPFNRETGIEIGSIVKPIVRVAVLKLHEDGKLNIDDTISKYFEDVPEDKKAITIKMLLTHTAGFRDVFGGDYEPMKRDDLMKRMLESELLFKPGSKNEYSNSGYSMLAAIVEKVTEEGLEQHISRTQFKPLGLKRFGYVIPKWKPEELMTGYDRKGQRWGTPREKFWYPDGPSWNLRGNGGMIATAKDLATWTYAAHDGRLMNAETFKLFQPGWVAKPPTATSLAAWFGGNTVFNTALAYLPHHKVVIIAASTDGRLEIENEIRPLLPQIVKMANGG